MGYSIDARNLAVIRKEIKETLLTSLQEARSGYLSDLVSIVYGDRTDIGNIEDMPLLWVLPSPHQPDLKGGHMAIHDFTFTFVVMVYDTEPAIGKDRAEDLTAQVYDLISSNRTLNGKVFDVRPLHYDPSYEAMANSNVYWASCEFAFRIQRKE
ncbi:hypothetical protein [Thermoactinomyces sp. DSM 45892]|uniref:hypothetical protein n=1 Tax=Thermoactinomyces sp. DSM 45892 TaxID=1882753 RepID=UPI00089CF336|nr:hypothetical protein [Thermoactinomyces sp. DSM 45892]SDY71895.1 hypothetical protein SAMN05444416_107166 [Thermoactinomyces sp. DSM 45892]